MIIFEWLAALAKTNEAWPVSIDLRGKTMTYKSIPIVRNGELIARTLPMPDGTTCAIDGLINFNGDPYKEIERLYAQFKRSVPGKRERMDKGNFKAVSSDLLTYQELENNMSRQGARLLLEGFILLIAAVCGIHWANPKYFFWQSSADPELIIYRYWITKGY